MAAPWHGIVFLVLQFPREVLRRALVRLYHVQQRLPAPVAKQWRLGVTLLLQIVPAMDPEADPYLTEYAVPACSREAAPGRGVCITGATGMVGLHLMDLLLRTTDARNRGSRGPDDGVLAEIASLHAKIDALIAAQSRQPAWDHHHARHDATRGSRLATLPSGRSTAPDPASPDVLEESPVLPIRTMA